MEILYQDRRVLVAIKPCGVRSTDEPGGMPELLRAELGEPQGCVRTVHRLDQVVGGVMVFARSVEAARRLSRQIAERSFKKEYLAAAHGVPIGQSGSFHDLLTRDRRMRKTLVADKMERGVQEALLDYRLLDREAELCLLAVRLHTGRTHQIRAQLAHHGLPLAGDKKYGIPDSFSEIGLWSHRIGFFHPETAQYLEFSAPPPRREPWRRFSEGFR